MSQRPRIPPEQVITNGDMSQATVTSSVTIVQSIPAIAYSFSWTGTPTGTFSVEVSNDYALNADGRTVKNSGTWSSLPLGGTVSVTADSGTGAIDVRETGFYAIRLVYTRSAGSGTLNAYVAGKVL